MLDSSAAVLLGTAASLGVLHTAIGPDHYVPFVALGRARGWSLRRTLVVTAVCGLGHVLSSVLIGVVGIGLGVATSGLASVESTRGSLAAWSLIAFGLIYATWSLVRLRRPRVAPPARGLTFWSLFVLFVFGPCEVLIPQVMAPAWLGEWWLVPLVAATFGAATLATMLLAVAIGHGGVRFVSVPVLHRWGHVLAGVVIAGSGLAIELLGV